MTHYILGEAEILRDQETETNICLPNIELVGSKGKGVLRNRILNPKSSSTCTVLRRRKREKGGWGERKKRGGRERVSEV